MDSAEGSVLLRKARDGSEEALDELFREVGPRLLALIRLRLGPDLRHRIESQDILQVTLLKAFLSIQQFEGAGQRSLLGWLGAIARNEIYDQIDFQGRKRRDRALEVPLEGRIERLEARLRTEVSRLHLQARELQLEQALERLSEEHRQVIVLREFEELSFREIGEHLDRSSDACRMLMVRARIALDREMAKAQ